MRTMLTWCQIPRIANRELVINMFLSFYKNLLDCYLDHPRAHASPCSSQCSYTPQVILNSCNKEKWLPVIFVSKFCRPIKKAKWPPSLGFFYRSLTQMLRVVRMGESFRKVELVSTFAAFTVNSSATTL